MKTYSIKLIALMLIGCLSVNLSFTQNAFDASSTLESSEAVFGNLNLDDLKNVDADNLIDLEIEDFKSIDYYEQPENTDGTDVVAWAKGMLAMGFGFEFAENVAFWCLHAGYYFLLTSFAASALYAVASIAYEGGSLNSGDIKRLLVDFQFKLLMFTSISKYMGWNFIWGILAAYAIGSEKDIYKTDITRLTLAAVVGFHLMLSSRLAIVLTTNILSWTNIDYKPENSNDYSVDQTAFIFNKSSIFAISLLLTLF